MGSNREGAETLETTPTEVTQGKPYMSTEGAPILVVVVSSPNISSIMIQNTRRLPKINLTRVPRKDVERDLRKAA